MAYGRLSTVTAPPPAGVTTTPVTIYAYDGFDRAISTTYPDNTASTPDVTSQSYDANGNVVARVTRDGQTISLSYDALNVSAVPLPPFGFRRDWRFSELIGAPTHVDFR